MTTTKRGIAPMKEIELVLPDRSLVAKARLLEEEAPQT